MRRPTLEEVVRILRRRWWLIVLSLTVGTAAGVLAYRLLPAEYESETVITVIPQRRPDSHEKSTVATSVEDRLRSIREQIQNRSRLEKVIHEYGLYKDRLAAGMEDPVQRMRSDIDVQLASNGSSFRLTYISPDRATAQKVTARLTALFMEETLPNRENLADPTSSLLESQLQDARGRLIEQEKKVAEYRRRYGGQLPLQLQGNLQGIQNAQSQLQALVESMNGAREGRLMIEREIAEAQTPSTPPGEGVNLSESPAPVPAGQQLEAARAQLEVLKLRHTPDHPEVLAQQQAIRDLQARVDEEAGPPAGPEDSRSRSEAAQQKRLSDLQAALKVADLQLAADRAEEVRLKKSLASYFGGIEAASRRGSELVELTRDYSTLQETYSSLLQKREDSKLAASLERRQIGEQFRILNPASLPERPHNQEYRLAALFWGPAGGLAMGLLLAGLLEYRDSSFKCEDDVLRVLSLPVLALIPVMEGEGEGPAHRRAAGDLSILLLFIGLFIASAAERVFSKLQA